MIITYNHKYGDNVTIKPYTIFTDPTPIKWTDDVYGYGYEYKPGDTFIYEHPINIYGQYNPIYINYFVLDENNDIQHIKYENRVGTRIEIAGSFFENNTDGFVCWNNSDGSILSAGQNITIRYNISAYVSCEYDFQLTYNASGGYGAIESQHGIMHKWIECDNNYIIYKHTYATIRLKENKFSYINDTKSFAGWMINGTPYYPGDVIELTSNTTAYAIWDPIRTYKLNADTICVNTATTFRYLMLNIVSTRDNKSLALSKVQFLTDNNTSFLIPNQTCVINGPTNAIELLTGSNDFIINNTQLPYKIVYDFNIQCINIRLYNKWRWHNISSSSTNTKQCIRRMQLLFSNDNIHWFLADNAFDKNNSFSTVNNAIAYEKTLNTIDYYAYAFNQTIDPVIPDDNPDNPPINPDNPQLYTSQIEYLETTGSQCIDTELDIKSTDNLRVVFDFSFITRKTNGKNQYFFSTASEWLSFEVDINSPYHAYANVGSTTLISWTRTTIPYDQWIHCDYNINAQNKTISITGWQNINSSYAGSHGIGTFYICSRNNSNYADIGVIAKFKPMQIYINDTLVRDFIPVRVGNIGYMYDNVSKKLFGNSGQGNFILGDDITSPLYVQCNYIEGNGGIINTGHIPTLNTSMEFEMMPIDYTGQNYIGFPYALADNNDNKDFRFFVISSSEMYFDFSYQRIGPKNVNFNTGTWYAIKCYNNGITINGITYTGSKVLATPYNCPIYVFGNPITGSVNFKLKYLKIYERGVLVKHLQAAINPNNEAGFYDFENKVWYGSINNIQMKAYQ